MCSSQFDDTSGEEGLDLTNMATVAPISSNISDSSHTRTNQLLGAVGGPPVDEELFQEELIDEELFREEIMAMEDIEDLDIDNH